MMLRLLYLCLVGLIGAVIVHLAIVLLLPGTSSSTAWSQISTRYQPFELQQVSNDDGAAAIAMPYERMLICRYDLGIAPLRLQVDNAPPMWSVSVHDDSENILFSANNSNIVGQNLDLIVTSNRQLRDIRDQQVEGLEQSLIINSDAEEGFVLVRVMEFDASWTSVTDAFFRSGDCTPMTF